MGGRKQVLVIAQHSGHAQVLAPMLRLAVDQDLIELDLFSLETAGPAWDEYGLAHRAIESCFGTAITADAADHYLRTYRPDAVVLGASNPLAFTGNHSVLTLGAAARMAGIPTMSLLDHWQGLDRFFASPQDRRPIHAPDLLGVPDAATADILAPQLPRTTVATVGQPHLEKLWHRASAVATADAIRDLRRHLGLTARERVLLVASQIVEERAAPKSRSSLLNIPVGTANYLAAMIALARDCQQVLLVRPHPLDDAATRRDAIDASDSRLVGLSLDETFLVSDAVIGWDSALLTQAAIWGLPVLSLQPRRDTYEAVDMRRHGIDNCIPDIQEAAAWLRMAPRHHAPADLAPALQPIIAGATQRSLQLLDRTLRLHSSEGMHHA